MDDDINRPITPPMQDDFDENNSDAGSLVSFNFDAPAEVDSEGAAFKEEGHGSNQSHRMPESIRNLGILLNKKRRAAVHRVMRGGATGCYDQDDSGTYDPKRRRATPDSPKNVVFKKRKIHSDGEDDEDGEKELKVHRKVGYSLMVTLTLQSEKGWEYLRGITPGESDDSDTSQDEESEPESDTGDGSFNNRRRRRREPERLGATYSRADGLTLDDLTEDHPQRRGCKACFEAGDDECTLIEHKFKYPCEACRDGSVECELIIPPKLKKSCERCKQKRHSCSYISDGGKGVEICDQCADEGVKCCAGPLRQSKRFDKTTSRGNGVRKSEVDDADEEVERMWVACNQCRTIGRRCTLKGKQDLGPCSGCRKDHEQCKFVLPPQRQLHLSAAPDLSLPGRKKQQKVSNYFSPKGEESPETPEEKNSRKNLGVSSPATNTRNLLEEVAVLGYKQGRRALKKGNRHILRKTSFCHPIQFNYIPDPMGDHPCDWCLTPFFGFYGLTDQTGPRTAEGYWLGDGEGFEEVCGGFADPGVDGQARERTRMCVGCTFERVRIFACPFHIIRPIANIEQDPNVWDNAKWSDAVTALENGDEAGGALVLNSKWCSICPELPSFTCSSVALFTRDGDAVEDEGCGLLLCERCEALTKHTLRAGIVSGNETIDAIVAETSRNRLLYPAGVRADSHFLTSSGELVMRMRQGMGMGSEDEAEAEVGNAGYGGHGGHGGFGGKKDAKGKGKSTTFNALSSPRPTSTPAREGQSRGFREEKGFGVYAPSTNQEAQLGNAWDGEDGSNPKWKGKGKEVERDHYGYDYGGGGNGGRWNNIHNSHSQPHTPINRAHSNAGPSYHQNSYVATNPKVSGGADWMNNSHPQPNVMHSNATGPSHHQPSYVLTNPNISGWIQVNNPHPQHLSSTSPSTFNNAGPPKPTNTGLMHSIDNSGVGSNSHIDLTPIYSDTLKTNTKMKAEPNTREEAREEMNGKGNAKENGKGKGMGMEKGKGKAEGELEVQGGGGNKTSFFDKQTGGWREVEVVDLCGEE